MSRSFKKRAICGITVCESEKQDKKLAHRKFRNRVKHLLQKGSIELLPTRLREVSEIWDFGKDGKCDWDNIGSSHLFRQFHTDEEIQEIIKKIKRK